MRYPALGSSNEADLDRFIISYPTYQSLLSSFVPQHLSGTTLGMPSHHQWLLEKKPLAQSQFLMNPPLPQPDTIIV
jgi:hypothetical protein